MNITNLFIRRPVLAVVVNLVIIIAGLQAVRTLNVRQYPHSENAAVTVTTVYVGADSQLVRGFITTPLGRAIAAADGIEYMEAQSKAGLQPTGTASVPCGQALRPGCQPGRGGSPNRGFPGVGPAMVRAVAEGRQSRTQASGPGGT